MKIAPAFVLNLLAGLTVLACGTSGGGWQADYNAIAPDVVRDRAPFELGCPRDQISVVRLGETYNFGARGCGKKAVYTVSCSGTVYGMKKEGCNANLSGRVMTDDGNEAH